MATFFNRFKRKRPEPAGDEPMEQQLEKTAPAQEVSLPYYKLWNFTAPAGGEFNKPWRHSILYGDLKPEIALKLTKHLALELHRGTFFKDGSYQVDFTHQLELEAKALLTTKAFKNEQKLETGVFSSKELKALNAEHFVIPKKLFQSPGAGSHELYSSASVTLNSLNFQYRLIPAFRKRLESFLGKSDWVMEIQYQSRRHYYIPGTNRKSAEVRPERHIHRGIVRAIHEDYFTLETYYGYRNYSFEHVKGFSISPTANALAPEPYAIFWLAPVINKSGEKSERTVRVEFGARAADGTLMKFNDPSFGQWEPLEDAWAESAY